MIVAGVERREGGLRLSADIELVMKFMRDYRIRTATDAARRCNGSQPRRPGMPVRGGRRRRPDRTRWRLPSRGRSEVCDRARRQAAGRRYTAMAEILVNGNAMNSELQRIPLVIGKEP